MSDSLRPTAMTTNNIIGFELLITHHIYKLFNFLVKIAPSSISFKLSTYIGRFTLNKPEIIGVQKF